jgi:HAD superfamily hydrolase (TIGR01509 family)
LVIFDCDGVLVDTERLAVPIDVELLAELGWVLSEAEVIERWLGKSEADFVADVEAYLGRPLPAGISFESERRYREAMERELQAVPGVVDALDRIEAAGRKTCVASSGTHEKMAFTLGLTGLWGRFEGRIFSASEVARGKPAPDLFLHAAEEMGCAPADCVVIEDSPWGVRAALAAGMTPFAYAGGLTPRHRLEIPGATIFTDMDELPALLGIRRA